MANKTASLKVSFTYAAPGGGSAQVALSALAVPYTASSLGTQDVPDTTPSDTPFDIPFGSIGTGATLLLVINNSGHDLKLKVNGGDLENLIPDGEYGLIEASKLGVTPMTSASVETTALMTADGSFDYFVFGDPL